jgi:hypothetical protein
VDNARAIPRVQPLNRTPAPPQIPQAAPAIPNASTIAGVPPIPVQQPLAYRSQTPDSARPTVNRSRSYQGPTAAPVVQAAPLHVAPSAPRNFPTVVAPQVDRGASSRASRPVSTAPLQRISPTPQTPATEPSGPAPAASNSSSSSQPRNQANPQQRGRRAFD